MFATHFHELALLQKSYPDTVRNFKVDTHVNDEGKLLILYKVLEGITQRSFGLNIAELVGFPKHVIKVIFFRDTKDHIVILNLYHLFRMLRRY